MKKISIIIVLIFLIVLSIYFVTNNKSRKEVIKFPINISAISDANLSDWEEYIKKNKPTNMIIYVNHVSSSEEPIVIKNEKIINDFLELLVNMKATKLADRFNGKGTKITYYFEDDSGKSMSYTFQNDLYKSPSARYYVNNIDKLNELTNKQIKK